MHAVTCSLVLISLLFAKSPSCLVNGTASESTLAVRDRAAEEVKSVLGTQNEAYAQDHGSSCNPACRNGDALLLVSTMDGYLTALDVTDHGRTVWSLETGPKLLSSSLSNIEVVFAGVPTRLVPSLDGSLYRLLHDDVSRAAMVEPMPFSADSLLSSTVRLTADATIVGSRETTTYGISVDSGKVKYVCDKAGCVDDGSSHGPGMEATNAASCLIAVRHSMQTVRAAAMRTGSEKWNFSVGQHEVNIVNEHTNETCEKSHELPEDEHAGVISLPSLKFDISKGMIKAYNSVKDTRSCQKSAWARQLPSAISKAWLVADGRASELNLFDEVMVLPAADEISAGQACSEDTTHGSPLLYVGSFEKQLYVQLSPQMQMHMAALTKQLAYATRSYTPSMLKVAWKPYIATAPSRTPWLNSGSQQHSNGHPLSIRDGHDRHPWPAVFDYDPTASEEHALTVYEHFDYPFDNGFYYEDESTAAVVPHYLNLVKNKSPTARDRQLLEPLDDDAEGDESLTDYLGDITYIYIQGSLWHYWKEVLIICIVFAVVVNIVAYKLLKCHKIIRDRIRLLSGREDEQQQMQPIVPQLQPASADSREPILSHVSESRLVEYTSRYTSDFEHIQCLGRGGFGVVFEAKNRIDDCSYAVKRISLPDSVDAKERVMREVKALAKLDHPGIVRYFQAWFETPPHDWRDDTGTDDLPPSTCAGLSTDASASAVGAAGDGMASHTSTGPFVPQLRLSSPADAFLLHDLDESSVQLRAVQQPESEDSFSIVFAAGDGSPTLNDKSDSTISFSTYADKSEASASSGTSEESGISECRHGVKDMCCSVSAACHNPESFASPSSSRVAHNGAKSLGTIGNHSKSMPKHQAHSRPRRLLLFIQMQLCKRETLKDYLTANTLNRDRSEMLDIFYQITNAVAYIHEQGLIHRDLKPSNIFFLEAGVVKVGDFGLVTPSTEYGEVESSSSSELSSAGSGIGSPESRRHTDNVGTQLYMSPEQVKGLHYSSKVDIYAMGLVFFELMYPFSTQMERSKSIQDVKRLTLPKRFCQELPAEGKFIKWLLQPDPEKRPDIHEVLHSKILRAHNRAAPVEARRPRQRTLSRPGD